MTACAIRYRLDSSGPATFLVDCDGQLRIFTRGSLGGVVPRSLLLALLADSGCRWVPGQGTVEIEATESLPYRVAEPHERPFWQPPDATADHADLS